MGAGGWTALGSGAGRRTVAATLSSLAMLGAFARMVKTMTKRSELNTLQ
jgi:hypothetical protein